MRQTTVFLFMMAACVGIVRAQKFDAASVKVDTRGIRVGFNVAVQGGPGTKDPGRFNISYGQPLKPLIAKAWDVPVDQIAGPAWLDDVPGNLYTITATMSPNTTREQFLLMLQNLLAERFHLAVHSETRDFPGYALVVAADKSKLKEWTPDPNAAQPPAAGNMTPDEQGFPRLIPNIPVGFRVVRKEGAASRIFETHHQSMADFAKGLGQALRQAGVAEATGSLPRVVDKTGLSGVWEFRFQFDGGFMGPEPGQSDVSGGPSFFTEIEKQLGLKLVKTKGVPVEVIVIDHVEKIPTEN
jgi:uncharacterized protein (TIGR03435 family)